MEHNIESPEQHRAEKKNPTDFSLSAYFFWGSISWKWQRMPTE